MADFDWRGALASPDAKLTHKRGGYDIWALVDPTPFGMEVVNMLDDGVGRTRRGRADICISGLEGECWVAARDKVESAYDVIGPEGDVRGQASADAVAKGRYGRLQLADFERDDLDPFDNSRSVWTRVRARRGEDLVGIVVPDGVDDVCIHTRWGSVEHGGAGCLILAPVGADGTPDLTDPRLVAADVAAMTYDLSPWGLPMTEPKEAPRPEGVPTLSGFLSNDEIRAHQRSRELAGEPGAPRFSANSSWWDELAGAMEIWSEGDHSAFSFGEFMGHVHSVIDEVSFEVGDDEDVVEGVLSRLPLVDLSMVGIDVESLRPLEEYGFATVVMAPVEASVASPFGRVGSFGGDELVFLDADGFSEEEKASVIEAFEAGLDSVGGSREIEGADFETEDDDDYRL